MNEEARKRALSLVEKRDYSRKMLIDKLTEKGASDEDAADVADWLCSVGVIDDQRYAGLVVRHYARKGYGPRRIREELFRRGIDREDGQGSTYDYGAVLFPEGFSDGDHIYLFNHEDVGSICRVGYIDEVEIELEDKLSNYLRSGVTPVPEKR